MNLSKFPSAIIFDFDGVILDSVGVKTRAFAQVVESHGPVAVQRMVAYHESHGGISRFEKFRWFYQEVLGRELSEAESQELGECFARVALDEVLSASFLPGVEAFLAAHRNDLRLFVASGTPQQELELIVVRRGLTEMFCEVHGTPRKKPEIIRDLLARHALCPHDVVFVGDAMTDYDAAVECGLPFIGIASDGRGGFPPGTCVLPDLLGLEAALKPS